MYNLLFGQNRIALILLSILNLSTVDVGRFRDAYLKDGKIIVYTRNGGGNREHWDCEFEEYEPGPDCPCPGCKISYVLPKHPNYVCDYDDGFDSTYAYVEFSVPEEYCGLVKVLEENQTDYEKFSAAIEKLKKELKND